MRVLGIDPGLNITGYCVIDSDADNVKLIEAGVIRTSAKEALEKRINKIYSQIEEILAKFTPEVMVLEKLYAHYKHPTTASLMAHARGVIALAASRADIKTMHYSATRIKKAVCGNGHASKLQIQRTMQAFFNLKEPPVPVDISDALALAVGHVRINSSVIGRFLEVT